MLNFRSKDTIVINGLVEAAIYVTHRSAGKHTLVRIQMVQTVASAVAYLRSPDSHVSTVFVDADQLGTDPAAAILEEMGHTPEMENLTFVVWTANRTLIPRFDKDGTLILRRPELEQLRHQQVGAVVDACDRGGPEEIRRALQNDLLSDKGAE